MDVKRLRQRVVELEEQLSSCLQHQGNEFAGLRNEANKLRSQVELIRAENQRFKLNVETLEYKLRAAIDEKMQAEEETAAIIENLNAKVSSLEAKSTEWQEMYHSAQHDHTQEKSKLESALAAREDELSAIRHDIRLLESRDAEMSKSKADTENQLALALGNYTSAQVQLSGWKETIEKFADKEGAYRQQLTVAYKRVQALEDCLEKEKCVLRSAVVENEVLQEKVKSLESALSEEKSCRETIEKAARQHQEEVAEKQRRIKQLANEQRRLQGELRAGEEKAQLDLQKKDQTLQTIARDLQHKKDLCSSLKRQLSEMSDAHSATRSELCSGKVLHEALLKEAHRCCQHILGHTRKAARQELTDEFVLEELRKSKATSLEKDHLILMLERNRGEAESRLQQETQSLEQNNHTIQTLQLDVNQLKEELSSVREKSAFSEETLLTQQREMDRLSQELDQALNENAALKESRKQEKQVLLSSMKVLAGRLTECLAQQPSAPLEQPTFAAPQDWDSLEHAHADLTVVAERVMQSHTGTQARVEELTGKLAAMESVWTQRMRDTIQRYKSRAESLQARLKVHKERETKLGEKMRGLSLSREALVTRAKKLQGTVGQLSRDSGILQSALVLCMGALVGSIDRLQQFTVEKTLLCRQISFLQHFQAGVSSQLSSLGGDVRTTRPCRRFRCAVISVMAAHRFMRLPQPSCVVCQIPLTSGVILPSVKILLPKTEPQVSAGLLPPSPVIRSSVMEGLQPLVHMLAHLPSTPLQSNQWDCLAHSMGQSLALEVSIFGREPSAQSTSLCAALGRGLGRLCKGSGQECTTGRSQQVLQGLSSALETLLQDVYSAREEKRRAEVMVSQVCSEREQLQVRVRHTEVMEQRVEILESELSAMVSPDVLSQLQDKLRRAVKGEESARERISAQVTQLEQAQLSLSAAAEEVKEKSAAYSKVVKAMAELKSQFASKEQSLRYTEKSLKREAREKKGLEQQLKSAEHTVDVLTSAKDTLLTYLERLKKRFDEVEPELIELSEEMAHDSYKPSSFKFLSDGATVSSFPVCQEVQETARRVLLQAATRTGALQREVLLCQNHVLSLRRELQDLYARTDRHSSGFDM